MSVAGTAGEAVPSVNWIELELRLDSVSDSVAVSVNVFWLDVAEGGGAEGRCRPVKGGVTGEPKPSTCPSRVPT